MILCGRLDITSGVNPADLRKRRLRTYIFLKEQLQRCFVPLSAFARSLLLRFIAGHLLIEIAFSLAAAGRFCAVDTKVFGDKILVDPVFDDQAPFAEGLYGDQQDQYYRDRILYHRAQS